MRQSMRLVWVMAGLFYVWSAALRADGPVRLEGSLSGVDDLWRGVEVTLVLDRAVPWSVVEAENGRLLVRIEGLEPSGPLGSRRIAMVPDGVLVTLDAPHRVETAEMKVSGGAARIRIVLRPGADEGVAEAGGEDAAGLVVAIDPGHGGRDPGAERDGVREADLMLSLARMLADELRARGIEAVLVRPGDITRSLPSRITQARAAGAGLLVSLHADALDGGGASGASVYTLSESGGTRADALMAQRHSRGDLISGLDLDGQGDRVAIALMELTRRDALARSEALAGLLARQMDAGGVPMNSRPVRQADLGVLKAADMPSVLVEAGFLSDAGDRARLVTPDGQRQLAIALAEGIARWAGDPGH
ncbi:N-acetylmuramoyl-L-alanine amidase family protein [Aestuariibius insulae]|uniref:N-acetylmuramoyl-L-alanine amidase family protein n=1 Tax=Aestuariibius insulae TaxID=2058287 RepID=UPI003473970A